MNSISQTPGQAYTYGSKIYEKLLSEVLHLSAQVCNGNVFSHFPDTGQSRVLFAPFPARFFRAGHERSSPFAARMETEVLDYFFSGLLLSGGLSNGPSLQKLSSAPIAQKQGWGTSNLLEGFLLSILSSMLFCKATLCSQTVNFGSSSPSNSTHFKCCQNLRP